MLRSVKKLVERNKSLHYGNHFVICSAPYRYFHFFKSCICSVNDLDKTYHIDNCGYDTPSTNRAIVSYRAYFSSKGYREV